MINKLHLLGQRKRRSTFSNFERIRYIKGKFSSIEIVNDWFFFAFYLIFCSKSFDNLFFETFAIETLIWWSLLLTQAKIHFRKLFLSLIGQFNPEEKYVLKKLWFYIELIWKRSYKNSIFVYWLEYTQVVLMWPSFFKI